MYKTANFTGVMEKFINDQMIYYVGQLTKEIICMGDDAMDFDETEEYFDCIDSNADTAINALSKYKTNFDNGFKHCKYLFPTGKSKKEAYELLLKTFEFLKKPELEVPELEIEFMIGISLIHSFEEKEYRMEFTSDKEEDLIDYINEDYPLSEEDKKEIREYINTYIENCEVEPKEAYSMVFDMLYNEETMLDFAFYDTDFLLLQNNTCAALKEIDKVQQIGIFGDES